MRWIERLKQRIYGISEPKMASTVSLTPRTTISCGVPERVLFVCSGNICRSAYGAVKLERLCAVHGCKIHVASCGTLKIVGRSAAPEMQAAARERGLDLSHHRSRAMSRVFLEAADIIFAMTPEHYAVICRESPECAGRTMLLGQFLEPPKDEIDDPMGQAPEAYRRAADEIDEALTRWFNSILSP